MRETIEAIPMPVEAAGQNAPPRDRPSRALLLASAIWCAVILAAPLLESPTIYALFSAICHQIPARTWFLQGEPLGVCIRCASIYGGFLLALAFGLRPRTWLLRVSLLVLALELGIARMGLDLEATRALSGALLGLTAAGFVEQGVRELAHHSGLARIRAALRSAT